MPRKAKDRVRRTIESRRTQDEEVESIQKFNQATKLPFYCLSLLHTEHPELKIFGMECADGSVLMYWQTSIRATNMLIKWTWISPRRIHRTGFNSIGKCVQCTSLHIHSHIRATSREHTYSVRFQMQLHTSIFGAQCSLFMCALHIPSRFIPFHCTPSVVSSRCAGSGASLLFSLLFVQCIGYLLSITDIFRCQCKVPKVRRYR